MKHPQELDINDWRSLDVGETMRVPCSHWRCDGKNSAFTITRTHSGCVYHCYRCGTKGYINTLNLSDAQKKIKEYYTKHKHNQDDINYKIKLPKDFKNMAVHTENIPPQAYAWLYKYEISNNDIYKFNIGYSDKYKKVIIPIYNVIRLQSGNIGYEMVGWQGRDIFYNENCKLFENGVLKNPPQRYYTIVNKNKKERVLYKIINNKLTIYNIYIVEDILSCIKVYNHFKQDTIALLNSTLTKDLMQKLYQYKNVYIWLDYDKQIYSLQTTHKFRAQGINCHSIITKDDPKAIPYTQIKDTIK